MLTRIFKVKSRIVYGGRLGAMQKSYYITYEDVETDKPEENTFPSDSEFTYTITYSNNGDEGKTTTFSSIDEINKELGNPDPNYESYSVFVDALERPKKIPNTSDNLNSIPDVKDNEEDDSDINTPPIPEDTPEEPSDISEGISPPPTKDEDESETEIPPLPIEVTEPDAPTDLEL